MNTLTKLAAPLLVATLSTTAPAVQAEPIVHKLDSLSYVQKNLLAQWDGINNVGHDLPHNSDATTWKDLTGNGYDFNNFTQNVPTKFSENALVTPTKEEYANSYGIAVKNSSKKNVTGLRAFDIYLKQNQKNRSGQDHSFMIAFVDKSGDLNYGFQGLAYSPNGIQVNNRQEGTKQHSIHNGDFNPHYFYFCYSADYKTASDSVIDGAQVNFSGLTAGSKGNWSPSEGMEIGYLSNYEPCANFYGMRVYGAALTPTQAKLNYAIDRKRFSNIEETLPEGYEWVGEEDARDIVIKNGITIGECQNGSIVMEGVPVVSGTYDTSLGHGVMLSAQANEGYVFKQWEASDAAMLADIEPTSSTVTLKGTDAPLGSIWAVFDKLENVKMKLILTPSDFGTITTDPVGEDLGDGAWAFVGGTEVTLTATPNEGFTFVAWGGDASGSTPTTTVKMDRLRTVQAIFKDEKGRFHTEWGYSNVVKVAGAKRCVLAFTKVGTHTLPLPSNVREMDYLVVGGGGGGGGFWGGGGGAGGLIASNGVAIAKGATLSVLVGAGGAGGSGSPSAPQDGRNGSASTLSYGSVSLVADGGGFGASNWHGGGSGGSGGGCGSGINNGSGGSATQVSKGGMGNNGGDGLGFNVGAGGGGASGRGGDNSSSGPGAGGLGLESSITGEPVCYAAGGAGGKGTDIPSNGVDGTGSGGGGSGNGNTGGKGGSGIVIVSYPIAASGLMLMIF